MLYADKRINNDDEFEPADKTAVDYKEDVDAGGAKTGFRATREGGRDYLVAPFRCDDTFTGKMLLNNEIETLIPVALREFNGESYIYYDVSGRTRFCDMFSGDKDIMEREDVERLCVSFEKLSGDIREYLLDIEELCVSSETLFYDPDKKQYEFLYIPGQKDEKSSEEECEDSDHSAFNEGVKSIWERVMEKFDHHSDIESIARVYDIYQKVSMRSFDPEEVFAPAKKTVNEGFSKESLKETISKTSKDPSEKPNEDLFLHKTDDRDTGESAGSTETVLDGIKKKLAESTGLFSGFKSNNERTRIEEISKNMDEESKPWYKIKEYMAANSGNIFKVLMCVAVLFLILALMPSGVAFKPPVSACVGIFLVCVAVAIYARKLGKDREEEKVSEKGA